MDQKKFQLAKQYEEQIKRLRKDLENMEKVTHLTCRVPYDMSPDYMPEVTRDLNEFPRLKAVIISTLEEELREYETKLEKL